MSSSTTVALRPGPRDQQIVSAGSGKGEPSGSGDTTKLPVIAADGKAGAVRRKSAATPGGGDVVGSSNTLARRQREAHKNPFRMPSDDEIFAMRDEQRKKKKEEREKMNKLKVYEKSTHTSRVNAKQLLDDEDDPMLEEIMARKDNMQQALTTSRDRHTEKENLADFIAKKREMFLVQYSLGVKRDEMHKLEDIAQAEERKLLDDEKALEEDAAKFDAFLKENDKNSVEAIKRAEAETKSKLEKVAEIKRINAQIMSIKSEMSKNEEQLKECQMYKEFLDKLTPPEFFAKIKAEREAAATERRTLRQGAKDKDKEGGAGGGGSGALKKGGKGTPRGSASNLARRQKSASNISGLLRSDSQGSLYSRGGGAGGAGDGGFDSDDDLDDTDPALYFAQPQQLLDIFAELEEQNLSLIQNSQETEEALEELKQKIADTQERMNKETESLRQQIEFLETAITFEDQKAAQLEERAKFFSFGVLGVEDQEQQLDELNRKVEEVYRSCIGDNEANISTLQMLTNIENKLEELFETIEMMPLEKVEQAEKMKDKERRQRLREEKLEAQRLHQEDRVKRALDRAKAPVKKKTGKPLVFRSAPPQKKKKDKAEMERKNEEEEEMKYYFQE